MYTFYDDKLIDFLDKKVRKMEHLTDDGLQQVNQIPNLSKEVDLYINAIKNADNTHIYSSKGQLFKTEIIISENIPYGIAWDITKCKQFITQNNLKDYEINMSKYLLRKKNFNLVQGKTNAGYDEPIIVANYIPINELLTIDGNHRIRDRLSNKEENVNGFLLNPDLHTSCMVSKLSWTLYAVHHNFTILSNYALGIIDKLDYKKSLNGVNIYPL